MFDLHYNQNNDDQKHVFTFELRDAIIALNTHVIQTDKQQHYTNNTPTFS